MDNDQKHDLSVTIQIRLIKRATIFGKSFLTGCATTEVVEKKTFSAPVKCISSKWRHFRFSEVKYAESSQLERFETVSVELGSANYYHSVYRTWLSSRVNRKAPRKDHSYSEMDSLFGYMSYLDKPSRLLIISTFLRHGICFSLYIYMLFTINIYIQWFYFSHWCICAL